MNYGDEISFTTTIPFVCGTSTVTDYDDNVYNTVQIGSQCWLKENLRTTHYVNGVSLSSATYTYDANGYSPSTSLAAYKNPGNASDYGYLYTWNAAVGGICPSGWHLPSDGEWTQLTQYVSDQSSYRCNDNTLYIAKALASTSGWNSSSVACTVGHTPSNNNASGFNALPAGKYCGYHSDNYTESGDGTYFWSSTMGSFDQAWGRYIGKASKEVTRQEYDRYRNSYEMDTNYFYFFSVRCLRD